MENSKHIQIEDLLNSGKIGEEIVVKGWVRTVRGSKNVSFINVNDGSTIRNIQIVAEAEKFSEEDLKDIHTGASVEIRGELIESKGTQQRVEVLAYSINVLGKADPNEYPLQPKKHSHDFLRECAHLRMRTNTFSAVFRIRHSVSFAIHKFFNDRRFYYIHTPVLTGSDAEGAGELFRVTSLNLNELPKNEKGKVDNTQDFFGKEANLTVSGQLEAELGALGLSKVYTFGPTFRAENSNTSRHAAEFWMVEPEMAFYDINDNMTLAEEFLKYVIKYVLENNANDIEFLRSKEIDEEKNLKKENKHEKDLYERLNEILNVCFERITYTEAIELLQKSKPFKKGKFEYPVEWGKDLQAEHERYLVEKKFKKPVMVTDYPRAFKAFYMYLNEDEKTVRGLDVLFPGIGEIIGGSQREHRYDKLKKQIEYFNIAEESIWWYLDSRKFGTVVHSGFGLGLERALMFITGISNIRDVIPFPRTPKNLEF